MNPAGRGSPALLLSRVPRNVSLPALIGIGRAFGGALIFALPLLMTMEMWSLGLYLAPWRLFLLTLVLLPLLVGLSHYAGFEATFGWREDLRHACIAYAVGIITSMVVLYLIGVLNGELGPDELVGTLAIQAMPCSIGALLARSLLGQSSEEERQERDFVGYGGELFLMATGALFLGLNLAPTEEMMLIAYKMSSWHTVALVAASIIVMHGFVYTLEFRGSAELPTDTPGWSAFARFTLVGYSVALLVSLFVLWAFGRTADTAMVEVITMTIVLGFPAAIGAAGARLIL